MFARDDESGAGLNIGDADVFRINGESYVLCKVMASDTVHVSEYEFLTKNGTKVLCVNIHDYGTRGEQRWGCKAINDFTRSEDNAAVRYFELKAANPAHDFSHLLEEKTAIEDLTTDEQYAFECVRGGEAVTFTVSRSRSRTEIQKQINRGMQDLRRRGLVAFTGSFNNKNLYKITERGRTLARNGTVNKY